MAGEIHLYASGPVSWRSAQLKATGLSSCENEYMGASRAAASIVPLRRVKAFLDGKNVTAIPPTVLFCDNQSAILISDANTTTKRMKHVMTRIAYLREQIEAKEIYLFHIGTKGELADIMTKPLYPALFHALRTALVHNP